MSEHNFWMVVDGLTACCGFCEGTIRVAAWQTGKCEFCRARLRLILWKRPDEFEDFEADNPHWFEQSRRAEVSKPVPFLCQNIRRLRQKRELTAESLSEQIGVEPLLLRLWELNELTPSSSNLIPLADALGVSVSEFLEPGGERRSEASLNAAG